MRPVRSCPLICASRPCFLPSRSAFQGDKPHTSAFEPACSGSTAAPPLPLPAQLPLPLTGAASGADGVETPTCLAAQPTVAALMHSSSLQLGAALPLPAVTMPVAVPLPAMVPTSTLGGTPAVPSSIDGSDGCAALSLPSRPGSVGPGHASDGPCQATSPKPKAGKAATASKGAKGGKAGGKDRASMTQAEKAALRRARRWVWQGQGRLLANTCTHYNPAGVAGWCSCWGVLCGGIRGAVACACLGSMS